ncbi:heteromeric transposase endonuclease subunit TnsA [Pseudoalteromonas sp. HM-SA03]|uniref:TnsA endonuclease N-terminal domain-containing protein n=1 Tax=Pseudoalteromonas sp. HM-SA03 TaxID=2029678 RepID=UPI000BAE3D80|nr:TnsA endonuclease N-terminal domain-containing protein [Pseudoalteromonas sp. HM-SA03]PAX99836.1 heteromeric transposase endonuclease subunit TnsA [Pseudoalteromonas sp. HM-SA03]
MPGNFKGLTQSQINKRIKEGRGQGLGCNYKPFIYTWEVSSLGRSHRIFGYKSKRIHHLLSDLELAVFLTLDWLPQVYDIREQFPLRVDDTVRIASCNGISHRKFKGVHQVLTSDFLVDFDDPDKPQMAFQAKYSSDLKKPGTIERLALEQKYWEEKEIPWAIITELDISKIVFINIQWLYPAQSEELDPEVLQNYFDLFVYAFSKKPNALMTEVAQSLDVAYDSEPGESLYWLRNLLARHYFLFDLRLHYRKVKASMLTLNNHDEGKEEVIHVPG